MHGKTFDAFGRQPRAPLAAAPTRRLAGGGASCAPSRQTPGRHAYTSQELSVTAVRTVAGKFDGPASGWHPEAGDEHAAVLNGRRLPGTGASATTRARACLAAGDIPLFRRLSAAGHEPRTGPPVTARARACLAAGDIPLFHRLSQRADQAGLDGAGSPLGLGDSSEGSQVGVAVRLPTAF